ncbi:MULTISPECIES: flagellar hook-associated protein FlgL [Cupriavidus]|uniref:Flagellin, N-terminal n=1 Tax=Cupriavidus pinatubonensis (strain JMP 134 / LMG 1197) TaxID=264198 RepID=Q46PF4_CUPPJ|nr:MULTISPECIES: flagellar hook-associated protein FlgL [Cupriavidus]QYY29621.1 flagellar hook-associated protein FlgL [Cupriavidus pinatubonensis]
MRVATSTLYQQGLASMNMQQSSLLHIQQQLGTGRKVLTPSDDPVAATRALGVTQASAINDQYTTSRNQANISLGMEENTLSTVTTVTQNIQTLLVQAGNGTLSDVDRASLATALKGQYEQLLGLANADDGNGQYLFGGTLSGSPPFVQGGGSVQYIGNTEQQQYQVDVARQMPAGSNGREVFQSVQGSAGYVLKGNSANTGSATYGQVSTTDPTNPLYGTPLTLTFDDSSGSMQYTITDPSGNPVGGTPLAYTDPGQIAVAGVTFTVKGAPKTGDTISIQPASQAGTDMFANLKSVIDALDAPVHSDADSANLNNVIATGIRQFSNSLDNVLTVRASVGSRMQELDALDTIGTNRGLNYTETLSGLQDLDYASAITEYYQRQTALQGAQQSFMQIQGMNLFKYL